MLTHATALHPDTALHCTFQGRNPNSPSLPVAISSFWHPAQEQQHAAQISYHHAQSLAPTAAGSNGGSLNPVHSFKHSNNSAGKDLQKQSIAIVHFKWSPFLLMLGQIEIPHSCPYIYIHIYVNIYQVYQLISYYIVNHYSDICKHFMIFLHSSLVTFSYLPPTDPILLWAFSKSPTELFLASGSW